MSLKLFAASRCLQARIAALPKEIEEPLGRQEAQTMVAIAAQRALGSGEDAGPFFIERGEGGAPLTLLGEQGRAWALLDREDDPKIFERWEGCQVLYAFDLLNTDPEAPALCCKYLPKDHATAAREAEFLQAVNGIPHVVRTHFIHRTEEGAHYFIQERASEGNAAYFFEKEMSHLLKCRLAWQLIQAVAGLHFKEAALKNGARGRIVHRDLKPQNILIDRKPGSEEINLILADMGSCALHTEESEYDKVVYTAQWVAPFEGINLRNVCLDEPQETKESADQPSTQRITFEKLPQPAQEGRHKMRCSGDIYSLGLILYRLFAGKIPHSMEELIKIEESEDQSESAFKKMGEVCALRHNSLRRESGISPEEAQEVLYEQPLVELLVRMTRYGHADRITTHEMMQHPAVQNLKRRSAEAPPRRVSLCTRLLNFFGL